MRILVLTLMMSFLSYSAFASSVKLKGFADPEEYKQKQNFETFPKEIKQLTTTFLSSKELVTVFSLVNRSSQKIAKEAIVHIDTLGKVEADVEVEVKAKTEVEVGV